MFDSTVPEGVITPNIEKHPHLVKRIKLLWGTVEIFSELEDISVKDTETRQGFDFATLMDLVRVGEAHEKAFPEIKRPLSLRHKFTMKRD